MICTTKELAYLIKVIEFPLWLAMREYRFTSNEPQIKRAWREMYRMKYRLRHAKE